MWGFLFLLISLALLLQILFLTHLFFFYICLWFNWNKRLNLLWICNYRGNQKQHLKKTDAAVFCLAVLQVANKTLSYANLSQKLQSKGSNTKTQDLFLLTFQLDCKQPCREGLGDTGRWEAGQEPALCTCSPETPLSLGLHKKNLSKRLREVMLLLVRPHLGTASSSGALSVRTWTWWNDSRGGPPKWSEGWSTSSVRKAWENWGCSAWRRESPMETLLQAFKL